MVHVLDEVLHPLVLAVALVVPADHGEVIEAWHQGAVGNCPRVPTEKRPGRLAQEVVNLLEFGSQLGLQLCVLIPVLVLGVLGEDAKDPSGDFLCLLVPGKVEGRDGVGPVQVLHDLVGVCDDGATKLQHWYGPGCGEVKEPFRLVGEVDECVGGLDPLELQSKVSSLGEGTVAQRLAVWRGLNHRIRALISMPKGQTAEGNFTIIVAQWLQRAPPTYLHIQLVLNLRPWLVFLVVSHLLLHVQHPS